MLVLVLNCWVMETKETLGVEGFHDFGKVKQGAGQPVDFIDHHHVDLAITNVAEESWSNVRWPPSCARTGPQS
jgi:hypothetical protein